MDQLGLSLCMPIGRGLGSLGYRAVQAYRSFRLIRLVKLHELQAKQTQSLQTIGLDAGGLGCMTGQPHVDQLGYVVDRPFRLSGFRPNRLRWTLRLNTQRYRRCFRLSLMQLDQYSPQSFQTNWTKPLKTASIQFLEPRQNPDAELTIECHCQFL